MTDGPPRHDVPKGGKGGFVLVDGRQVHELEWGNGRDGRPAVVCLHGGGQTAYMYEEMGYALGDRFHVFAPDLPAHGDSDALDDGLPPDPMGALVPFHFRIAETLPAWFAAHGIDRAFLIGASLGGMTSIALADRHPELVAGIALIDVGHRLEPEGVRKIVDFMTAHESFASLDEAAAAIGEYLPQRRAPNPASLSRNLRQRADGRWEWKHALGRRQREYAEEGGEVSTHPADRLDQFLEGLDEAASRLTCPVLILRGDQSDVLSADGAAELEDLVPNARVEVIEKAGHLAVGDNPRSSVALIESWLDELTAG